MRICYPNEKLLPSRLFNLLDYRSRLLSIMLTVFPKPFSGHGKIWQHLLCVVRQVKPPISSFQQHKPISGTSHIWGQHTSIIYHLYTTTYLFATCFGQQLTILMRIRRKSMQTAISCSQVPILYLQSKENIRNPKKMTYHHINNPTKA